MDVLNTKNRWPPKFEMRRRMLEETVAEVGDDIRQLSPKACSNVHIDAQKSLALKISNLRLVRKLMQHLKF